MEKINWVRNNQDFVSADGKFVAIFVSACRGLATYKVFSSDISLRDRTAKNMLSIGGLPEFPRWEKRGNDNLPFRKDNVTKMASSSHSVDACSICNSRMNVICRDIPSLGKMNICMHCLK
jgi:hypothetical protein